MTMTLSGTGGVTFPVVAGSAGATQASSARVLQVVQTATATTTSTTSLTYGDATGLSVSITPTSASSKILVLCDLAWYIQADNNTVGGVVIARNGTNIWRNDYYSVNNVNANVALGGHGSFNYLDSPATTSALTYKIQIRRTSTAGTSYAFIINGSGADNASSSITVMEIAA